MSTKMKSGLKWTTHIVLVAMIGTLVALHFSSQTPVVGQSSNGNGSSQSEPLTPYDFHQIVSLRNRLNLRDVDLAAIECSDQKVTEILNGLRTWHDTKRDQIIQARRTTQNAQRAFRKAIRRINVGPREGAPFDQMINLQQSMTNAFSAEKAIFDQAESQVSAQLSQEQGALWAVAKSNRSLPDRYRFVSGLTADQRKQLKQIRQTARRQNKSTTEVEAGILSGSQISSANLVMSRIRSHIQRVGAASRAALPVPEDLIKEAAASDLPR